MATISLNCPCCGVETDCCLSNRVPKKLFASFTGTHCPNIDGLVVELDWHLVATGPCPIYIHFDYWYGTITTHTGQIMSVVLACTTFSGVGPAWYLDVQCAVGAICPAIPFPFIAGTVHCTTPFSLIFGLGILASCCGALTTPTVTITP